LTEETYVHRDAKQSKSRKPRSVWEAPHETFVDHPDAQPLVIKPEESVGVIPAFANSVDCNALVDISRRVGGQRP